MKKAGPVPPMSNDFIAEFATWPVGPGKPATTGGRMAAKFVAGGARRFAGATPVLPVTWNRLEVPAPWFEIQNGLAPGINETPHGFIRFESVIIARPDLSETRSVCLNCAWAVPAPAQSAPKATLVNMTA